MIPAVLRCSRPSGRERADARRRSAPRRDVQLRDARSACPGGPSAAADSPDDRRGAAAVVAAIRPVVLDDGAAVDPAREVAARVAAADAVQHSQRAAADGGAGLQRSVPVVRRPESRRSDLGRHDVHEESRPAARAATSPMRSLPKCSPRSRRTGLLSDEHFTVDGTLLEAWASHKSFKPKGTDRTPAGRSRRIRRSISTGRRGGTTPISRRRIPTRGCIRKRSGREAKLGYLGASADGESPRLHRRHGGHRRDRHGRTRRRDRDARRVAADRAAASRSAPTRTTTRAPGSPRCARWASRRMSRSTTGYRGGSAIDGRTTRHRRLRGQPTATEDWSSKPSAG